MQELCEAQEESKPAPPFPEKAANPPCRSARLCSCGPTPQGSVSHRQTDPAVPPSLEQRCDRIASASPELPGRGGHMPTSPSPRARGSRRSRPSGPAPARPDRPHLARAAPAALPAGRSRAESAEGSALRAEEPGETSAGGTAGPAPRRATPGGEAPGEHRGRAGGWCSLQELLRDPALKRGNSDEEGMSERSGSGLS